MQHIWWGAAKFWWGPPALIAIHFIARVAASQSPTPQRPTFSDFPLIYKLLYRNYAD